MKISDTKLFLTVATSCLFSVLFVTTGWAQPPQSDFAAGCRDRFYLTAYDEIAGMLDGKTEVSVKRTAFLLEWAYLQGQPDYMAFCREITRIADTLNAFMKLNHLDKHPIGGNLALFEFFTHDNPLNGYKAYTYDFDDYMGDADFSNTFVTKLMHTHSGQCRSLPLFYKILADEIGAEAFIAYAPMHSFIRHRSEDGSRWFNVELTNHTMPRETFIIENSGISQRALETGVYMKPCDDRAIVLELLIELTYGYERRYGIDSFVERCTDAVLRHDPDHLPAWMRRADKLYCDGMAYQQELRRKGLPEDRWSIENHARYVAVTKKITDLGYVETTPERYDAWMQEIRQEIERRKQTANNR